MNHVVSETEPGWFIPWAALVLALPNLALLLVPQVFLAKLSEIPSDFLTGLLTFDGIMVAVVALTFPISDKSDTSLKWLVAELASPFLLSAILALYSLLRLHVGEFGAISSGIGISAPNAIGFASLGMILWLLVMLRGLPQNIHQNNNTTNPQDSTVQKGVHCAFAWNLEYGST